MASIEELIRLRDNYRRTAAETRLQLSIKETEIQRAWDEGNYPKGEVVGLAYVEIQKTLEILESKISEIEKFIAPIPRYEQIRQEREKNVGDAINTFPPLFRRIKAPPAAIAAALEIHSVIRRREYYTKRVDIRRIIGTVNQIFQNSYSYRRLLESILNLLPRPREFEEEVMTIFNRLETYAIKFQFYIPEEDWDSFRSSAEVVFNELDNTYTIACDEALITSNVYRVMFDAYASNGFQIVEISTSAIEGITLARDITDERYAALEDLAKQLIHVLVITTDDDLYPYPNNS